MNEPRTRFLATAATALGLLACGFEAHLAPQVDGWWHGLTGGPSPGGIAGALAAAMLVWRLGRIVNVRPFMAMVTGLLPLIPATTGYGEALLLFSGYTMLLLLGVLLGWTCRDLIPRMPVLRTRFVAVIAFSFFVLVGRYLPGPAGPQGDEPHYLLIAESLLQDRDLDLKNQFDERAFAKFTGANLEPHTAPRSPLGKVYAIHTPGLSALIAPGYAWFGFAGARAMVSFVMAVVVSLLYLGSKSLFGAQTANFVFLLATFASPLPIYANSLFPDSVATLPVAATLACLIANHPALPAFASTTIAILPWLHPRFLPLAFVLALSMALRGGWSLKRIAVAFAPLFISWGLLLFHFHSIFGDASLSAAYGPNFSKDVSLTRIPWGITALILDRQFGLLLFSPVLLLGLSGASSLWKRDRMVAMTALALGGAVFGVGGAFSMWWGGASPPSRFLIGAVPALLFFCGSLWQRAEARPLRRGLVGAVCGFGLGLLALACLAPRTLHNRPDGGSALLRLLAPMLDLDRFFPGFVEAGAGSNLWTATVWGVLLIASLVRPRVVFWVTCSLIGVVAVFPSTPLLDPFSSSLRALESWSDRRRSFGGHDTITAFSLDVPLDRAGWNLEPGTEVYSARFSLPRGAWTMRVESRAEETNEALNVARIGLLGEDENAPPLATLMVRVGENVVEGNFDLEQSERRVHLRGQGLQSRVKIVRVKLSPRNSRP